MVPEAGISHSGFFICFRSQRLQFDVSSPNGILLFREVSKMIVSYGKCDYSLYRHLMVYCYSGKLVK